jgi:hypothetical protein
MIESHQNRSVTKYRVIVAALLAIIAGMVTLELSSPSPFDWRLVAQNFGAFLIGTATVALLWEWFAKRSFFEDILSAVRLSTNIRDAGIERFSLDYKDFDWKALFEDAGEVDVFFTYARSWRNNYIEQIRAYASRDNVQMRVLLPNPTNEELVSRLSQRFGKEDQEVARYIREAAEYFKTQFSVSPESNAQLEIRYTERSPQYAFYRFDGVAIITFFNQLGRTGKVPCFCTARGGSFFDFASNEFNELFRGAKSLYGDHRDE